MVNIVTFVGFRGGRSPQSPPSGSAPGTNLLVSVGQTKRQRIKNFYVNEVISINQHRAPTYQFQLRLVSFTEYFVLFTYCLFTDLGIGDLLICGGPWL